MKQTIQRHDADQIIDGDPDEIIQRHDADQIVDGDADQIIIRDQKGYPTT